MVRTIEVTEYDIAWTRVFDEEAMALKVIFGDSLVTIHHIGSTAIPAGEFRGHNTNYLLTEDLGLD
jgi:GrpB-like predicted nucleotidyltransferase (UPF0157 family)